MHASQLQRQGMHTVHRNRDHKEICCAERVSRKGLRRGFAAAVWDFEARLQFATGIHETPFIFPGFAGLVELDFPWFVKGFEPVNC